MSKNERVTVRALYKSHNVVEAQSQMKNKKQLIKALREEVSF